MSKIFSYISSILLYIILSFQNSKSDLIENNYNGSLLYATEYNPEKNIPHCSAYILSKDYDSQAERYASFTQNPNYDKSKQVVSSDYRNTGYDRGHLAPAADFFQDRKTSKMINYVTNIAPQDSFTNQKPWRMIEDDVREFSKHQQKDLFIVTCVSGNDGAIKREEGESDIVVPRYYYKAVCGLDAENGTMVSFVADNTKIEDGDDKTENERIQQAFQGRTFQEVQAITGDTENPFIYFKDLFPQIEKCDYKSQHVDCYWNEVIKNNYVVSEFPCVQKHVDEMNAQELREKYKQMEFVLQKKDKQIDDLKTTVSQWKIFYEKAKTVFDNQTPKFLG